MFLKTEFRDGISTIEDENNKVYSHFWNYTIYPEKDIRNNEKAYQQTFFKDVKT